PLVRQALILVGFVAVLMLTTTFGGRLSERLENQIPFMKIRDYTVTFYSAPEHATPPGNLLDPYDSFVKDANDDLVMSATGTNVFSEFNSTEYREYVLKTHRQHPIRVYQATPSRRKRYMSNCHGLTFLGGSYWLNN